MCPVQTVTHVSGRSLRSLGSSAWGELAWDFRMRARAALTAAKRLKFESYPLRY
jgi:hypothetical protein